MVLRSGNHRAAQYPHAAEHFSLPDVQRRDPLDDLLIVLIDLHPSHLHTRSDRDGRSWERQGTVNLILGRGAVPALRPVRFPDPLTAPGVRVSTHRALRVSSPLIRPQTGLPNSGSMGSRWCCRDSGSGSQRRWMRR